jgi:hypothetical protein
LYDGETLVDAVQVGEGTASFGEGLPVLMMDDATVVFRVANVDTNDNLEDFKIGFVGTPGT